MNDGPQETAGFASSPIWGKKPELLGREGEEEERWWGGGTQMEDAAVADRQGTQFTAPVGRD